MNQPTPIVSNDDVQRIIKRDFSENLINEAVKIIDSYGIDAWHREIYRVQIAALKIANGNLDKLKQEIENAQCDYRDTLLSAEYPLNAKKMFKKLNDAELACIYEKDWEQYQAWLNR